MSGLNGMRDVVSALAKYASEHEDYAPNVEIEISLSLAGKWSKRKMGETAELLANDPDRVGLIYRCKKEIQTITGHDPLFVPNIISAKIDKRLIEQIAANGCAFIAVDDPEQSVNLVKSYRVVLEIGKQQGVREHYQTISANKLSKGRKQRQKKSKGFANSQKDLLERLEKEGIVTYQAIADKLNEMQIPTPSGKGKWHINTVQRVKKQGIVEKKEKEKNSLMKQEPLYA